jgi:two-component sensor histidine kinase/CHASE1-domain containing sensor protein
MALLARPRSTPARTAAIVAGAGAIYWLAARLALWMAIPPGYATAVWPAAGLGLICALAWGRRAALGIALGSVAVNVATGFDATSLAGVARSLALAGAIGGGAALQSALGAALIRRRIGFPSALYDERDIIRFIVLGGPVACLVSSTIGVAALAVTGALAWPALGFHWWTWWVGDTIGVLVFAPLALLAVPGGHAVWRRRRGLVGLPLVLGFAGVTVLFLRVSAWERARLRTDFERRIVPVEAVVKSQLSAYAEVVMSLASFFDASDGVTRDAFHVFCARALANYPAILGLSWNPRVPAAQRGEVERRARADGLAGFAITERDPTGQLRIADPRPDYVPVYYIEPQHAHLGVLGYDIASDPTRRDALDRVSRYGGLAATERVDLVPGHPGDSPYPGVLLMAPAYVRTGAPGPIGYAVGVFRVRDLIEIALRDIDHDGMSVTLIDRSPGPPGDPAAGVPGAVLYTTEAAGAPATSELRSSAIEFGDRRWELAIAPTAALVAAQRGWQAWTVLAGGLLFVGLLGVVLLITTGRAFRIRELNAELEHRVEARTAELTAALREREVLLQEIHHRVKNNLQVISSLMSMQVRKLGASSDRVALEECQTRVEAIALVHEQLYQSHDYANVPFSEYTRTLVGNVFRSMRVSPGSIELALAIDDVAVPVDKAIPCGLLLNELITNALKHAFPGGRSGALQVELGRRGDQIRLVVADNGVGLPPGLDVPGSRSLGLRLVNTLVRQLRGTLAVDGAGGARFELAFTADG